MQIGEPSKRIDDLNNGSLLPEVATEEQSHRIRGLEKLVDTEVEVTELQKLNTIQSTILDTLNKQIVSNCYNIPMKNNGTPRATSIFILNFDACSLPDNVKIGYKICDVREYTTPSTMLQLSKLWPWVKELQD